MLTERRLGLGEQPRQLNSRMIFTPDRSLLYVSVPKTGCTTIKMIIGASVGLLSPQALEHKTRGAIHSTWNARNTTWSDLIDEKRNDLLTGPSTFRVTSVRNPFERVVSCYLNKITGKNDSFYLARKLRERGDTSIHAFLEFVRDEPPLRRDVHCRAMTDLCFSGRVQYDDLIRYETFEIDLRRMMVRLDLSTHGIPKPAAASKTNAGARMHDLLGPRECELVREIYAADFKEFGYSLDLP
ncbi:MAG: sulfotransferase family 2 domain-containing protein [Caulobacteraceae bacterium]|nr:sulfotransferase family 2 domain-containing protein [Caulobacteraceae bacterium]